ncbi:hypothetical protein B0H14DRAFT_2765353 [Mycena olivaceomarginata]|nr:hypothetical protein B0H14DRAFT_2765353 [Mycena olivaceomarginata]
MAVRITLDDPRLPPELEQKIFEIAALLRPTRIPTLMLVVEPLLYRVVFLGDRYGDDDDDLSHDRLRHVRHLLIGIQNWLLACSNITTLYAFFRVSSTSGILPCLSGLTNIRYLTIDSAALLGSTVPSPLFHTVTHLELLDFTIASKDDICRNIALIPHLTHLAINPSLDSRLSHPEISANTQLQCIVFLSAETPLDGSVLLDDNRFVCIDENIRYYVDWLKGAVSGDDYWSLADAFLAARRAGKNRAHVSSTSILRRNLSTNSFPASRYRISNGGDCKYDIV